MGASLLDKILKTKYNVFILDNKPVLKKQNRIKCLSADISDKKELEKYRSILNKIDFVVHLAAYVPLERKFDDLEKSININIKGSANLANLLKGGTTFILASTTEIYNPHTFYALSKISAEKFLEAICNKRGIRLVSLRFASIYGPGEKIHRATPNFIRSAVTGGDITIFGDGKEKRSFLYIEDAVQAIEKAILYGKEGVFDISSEEAVSILGLAKLIKKISGSKSKIIFQPREKEKINLVFSAKKAKRELKFRPKFRLADGIKREIEYFKRHG